MSSKIQEEGPHPRQRENRYPAHGRGSPETAVVFLTAPEVIGIARVGALVWAQRERLRPERLFHENPREADQGVFVTGAEDPRRSLGI